jgi:hypothetical protein
VYPFLLLLGIPGQAGHDCEVIPVSIPATNTNLGIYIHDSLNSGFLFGAFNLEAKFEISSIHCSRKLREQKTKILHFCELLSLWIDTGRGITMRAISGNLNEITSVLNKPINRDNRRRVTLLTVKAYR